MAQLRAGYRAFLDATPLTALVPDRAEARRIPAILARLFRVGTQDSMAEFRRVRQAGHIRLGPAPDLVTRRADHWEVGTGGETLKADLVLDATGAAPGDLDPFARSLVTKGWLAAVEGGITVGPAFRTRRPGLSYLSASVSEIGDEFLPLPLYDVCDLARLTARSARQEAPCPH